MNGFSAADMSTAAANGFRDGLAAQPAAAPEAVGWQRSYKYPDGSNGPWCSVTKESYDETISGKWAHKYEVRALYAAPVAAAPVCADCSTPLLYECIGCSATNYPASTPAAPGIDLAILRELADDWSSEAVSSNGSERDALRSCAKELRGALGLLDASPKGGSDDFGAMTDLLARWRHNASIESSPNMAGKARREVWVQCLGELEFALQATSAEVGA